MSASVSASACSDELPARLLLHHKVTELRRLAAEDERQAARLRSRLAKVEGSKAPLLRSLQQTLAAEQRSIDSLRLRLSSLHLSLSQQQREAVSVYEAAVRDMEADYGDWSAAAQAESLRLTSAVNALLSYEAVESRLRGRCAELQRAAVGCEEAHRRRLESLQREWAERQAAVASLSCSRREDSQRRYKQRVMQSLNISYSAMAQQLQALSQSRQADCSRMQDMQHSIQQRQGQLVQETEDRRREERRTAAEAERLLQLRLQLRQTRREAEQEAQRVVSYGRAREEDERLQAEERLAKAEELRRRRCGWQSACQVKRRSVSRLQSAVGRVEAALSLLPFHALLWEALQQTQRGDSLQALRLLFRRISEAERRREQLQRQTGETARQEAGRQETEAAGSSFFLTQSELQQAA